MLGRIPRFALLLVLLAGCVDDVSQETGPNPVETTGDLPATSAPEASDGVVVINPEDEPTSVVDASPPGSTFRFTAGVHRGVAIAAREGDVFTAEADAVLSGSVIVEEFAETEGQWRAPVDHQPDEPFGQCRETAPLCGLPEELFVDGEPLERVGTGAEVGSDTWWFDPAGPAVVIGQDPSSHLIELSVTPWAIRGSASDVTIQGVRFVQYANHAGTGVVHMDRPAESWHVEDCDIADGHGVGIVAQDNSLVSDCDVDAMGQQGIGAGGANVTIEKNTLTKNNRLGFDPGWSAGGGKFAMTDGLIIRDNTVRANDGAGLWTDIDCVDTVYEGNLVEDNTGAGIFHEISYRAEIRDNRVTGNGADAAGWIWGAGIQIAASSDVTVVGNVVERNRHGIAGVDQLRGEGALGEYRLENLTVIDNVVRDSGQVGIAQDHDAPEVYERNHRFEGNTYEGEVVWSWADAERSFEEWRGFGNDLTGVYRPD